MTIPMTRLQLALVATVLVTILAMYYAVLFFGKLPQLMFAKKTFLTTTGVAPTSSYSITIGPTTTTETGPIAACVPGVPGHVVLLPDLFVEVLGPTGERLADGVRGELTVTGGRNRYLPLVRYRTGDYGRLATVTLSDGRPARTILDLEGRAPVGFRATDGGRVTSVDVARRIRPLAPFVQHALHQRIDGSLELRLRPLPGVPIPREDFEHTLRELFGRDAQVEVVLDPGLGAGGGKIVAWRRDGAW